MGERAGSWKKSVGWRKKVCQLLVGYDGWLVRWCLITKSKINNADETRYVQVADLMLTLFFFKW